MYVYFRRRKNINGQNKQQGETTKTSVRSGKSLQFVSFFQLRLIGKVWMKAYTKYTCIGYNITRVYAGISILFWAKKREKETAYKRKRHAILRDKKAGSNALIACKIQYYHIIHILYNKCSNYIDTVKIYWYSLKSLCMQDLIKSNICKFVICL